MTRQQPKEMADADPQDGVKNMAAFTYEEFVPASPLADHLQRFALAIGNAVLSVTDFAKKSYLRAQTRRQLEALSDRQLEDIGMCRGDIDALVARV